MPGLNGNHNLQSLYIGAKVPEITEQYKGTQQYPASYSYGQNFPIGVKQIAYPLDGNPPFRGLELKSKG